MKSANKPVYESPLRQQQKADTRALILETMERLLKNSSLESLSLASVAREAGITERTVYRHFETREALLEAIWARVHESVGMHLFPTTATELIALPQRVFPALDERADVIRAMLASPQGRELRMRVNKERQAAIRSAVLDAKPRLKEPTLTRMCAAVQLLQSAAGWATMNEYWGLRGADAGRAASEAIAALLDVPIAAERKTPRKPAR